MKIIEPSAQIMTELDKMSLAERIGRCAAICYKSEGKLTDAASAEVLAGKMVKSQHNSTLEMAPVTMEFEIEGGGSGLPEGVKHHPIVLDLFESCPKYLVIDSLGEGKYLISSTVRGFREFVMEHPESELGWAMRADLLPSGLVHDVKVHEAPSLSTVVWERRLSLNEIDKLPPKLHLRHRQVTVKFIVNRAVTHEIVRHRPVSFLQESQRYCSYDKEQFGNEVTFIKPMFFAEGTEEYALWREAMAETESVYLKLLKTSSPQAARTVLPNSCKTEIIVQANLVEWEHILHLRCGEPAEPSMREVMIPLREDFCKMFPGYSFDRRMPEGWVQQ